MRSLRETERQECLDLWCTVWPGEGSPAYFQRYFSGDVEALPYYTQVGVLNDKIVSAVHICKRTVACGDFRLTMGGIANVATLPEFRGHGYNTRCLQSAIVVMEADAMDFSLLFTGINGYYARYGFETLRFPWLSGTVSPLSKSLLMPCHVRQALASDLPAIQQCYDTYNRQRPIAVQRTPAYWRDWINIHPDHIPENLLVAIDSDNRFIGYVQTGVFKSAVAYSAEAVEARVIAYGTVDGLTDVEQVEIAMVLLQAVIAKMDDGKMDTEAERVLRLEVAREPAIKQALETLLNAKQEHWNTSGMVRLLHRDNLLRGLTMGLNDRWITAGRPAGVLTFSTPYGPVMLDANGAFLRVVAEDGASMEIMPQATLFGLLFGMLSPDKATTNPALHPLLAALFPQQNAIYYGADGF